MYEKTASQEPPGHRAVLPIGSRIRQIREKKGLTQGDVERRTGLMRCYISRVENGFKLPSIETLERFACAFELPLYRLFYDGAEPTPVPQLGSRPSLRELLEAVDDGGPETRFMRKLCSLWSRMGELEHQVLLDVANRLADREEPLLTKKPIQAANARKCRRVKLGLTRERASRQFEAGKESGLKPAGTLARESKIS